MNLYNTGDFSKILGISREHLRYYENKQLVQPIFRDENNYRLYASPQAVHFMEYKNLQLLGFDLKDADTLLRDACLDDFIDKFYQKADALQLMISNLNDTLKWLEHDISCLEQIRQNQPFRIIDMENYVFCELPQDNILKNREWNKEGIPHQFWSKSWFPKNTRHLQHLWGYLMKADTNYPDDWIIHPIQPAKCFYYCYSIPASYDESGTYLQNNVWNHALPLKLLKENNLSFRGDFYQRRIYVTHEADNDFLQIECIIPLNPE